MDFDDCPSVRLGVPEDIEAIMELARLVYTEAAEHKMNEDAVRQRVAMACFRQGALIGVIGPVGGPLRGHILLMIDPIWYSEGEYQLLELSMFVAPEHRQCNYAKQLITFAKLCGDRLQMDVTIGVFSNHRTEAKCRLYRRHIKKVGEFFCYSDWRKRQAIAAE